MFLCAARSRGMMGRGFLGDGMLKILNARFLCLAATTNSVTRLSGVR